MQRHHDWPERLSAFIATARARPFAYGPHDCVSFANGAVEAMTGKSVMPRLRYSTALGALRALKREGGVHKAIAARLPEIPPATAQRGDVGTVLVDTPNGPTTSACIVLGEKLAAAGADGLTFLSRSRLRAAFRV